jgi:NAD(P)-dependent dehydrogenase (short-subunit alcohol dehydrogenase family)
VLHQAAPLLKSAQGLFIAIGSRSGSHVFPDTIAYGASKAALAYAVRAVSRELAAEGVRVICLNPGGVATPMRTAAFPNEDPTWLMQPDEIGGVVAGLARLPAAHLAGAVIDYPW